MEWQSVAAVLFDFDMTLVDSSYIITECTNLLAEAKGLPRVTREELLKVIGLPIEESWRTLWGQFDESWLDFYRSNFRAREQTGFIQFPGTIEVPELLKEMGVKVGVVSNRRFAYMAVEHSGLAHLFDTVVGLEDVGNAKPHPESILLALERLGIEPAQTVYVGDTDIDMKTAVAANVRGIGMTTGAFEREQLLEVGATWVCDDLREIPNLLCIQNV